MTWERRLYFPSEGRHAEDFFALKNPTASAGFEPANLGTKGQHATSRPPKPLKEHYGLHILVVPFPHNTQYINPLNAELNPICHLLALLGAHHILHVSRVRVNMAVTYVTSSSFLCTAFEIFCMLSSYDDSNSLYSKHRHVKKLTNKYIHVSTLKYCCMLAPNIITAFNFD